MALLTKERDEKVRARKEKGIKEDQLELLRTGRRGWGDDTIPFN